MGTVYTNEVTLTVTASGPVIDPQPQNTTVDENTTATFTIGATGVEPLFYSWFRNANPVGDNSTTYSYEAVEGDDGDEVFCIVADDDNNFTVSDTATLTVTALFPTITVQPQSQTVDELDDVTFTVEATASAGTLSYQWYRNGGPVGTNTNSYSYQALLVDDADTIYCDVSDSNGTTTSTTATLTVTDLVITIDTQPQSIDEVPALTAVSFSVTYTSSYPASVQWYKDGEAVVGEIADTYSFVLQDTDEGSEIYATVSSVVDTQTSDTATIGFVLEPVTDLTYTVVKSDYRKPISKRGYVVLNRPLEEGESLSIERVTNVDNDLPAVEGEAFVSEGWEYQLDRFTLRLQEIEAHACDCSEEDTFPESPPEPPPEPPPTEGCEPYACDSFSDQLVASGVTVYPLMDANTEVTIPADGVLDKIGDLPDLITEPSAWGGDWDESSAQALKRSAVPTTDISLCALYGAHFEAPNIGGWETGTDPMSETVTTMGGVFYDWPTSTFPGILSKENSFRYTFTGEEVPRIDAKTTALVMNKSTNVVRFASCGQQADHTLTEGFDTMDTGWFHVQWTFSYGAWIPTGGGGGRLPVTISYVISLNGAELFSGALFTNFSNIRGDRTYSWVEEENLRDSDRMWIPNVNQSAVLVYAGQNVEDMEALYNAFERNKESYTPPAECDDNPNQEPPYVPEWVTQECNEFSCDSTENWLTTYTDGTQTGYNLLTGSSAVGSTLPVAGELWPVVGSFAAPTTPGVFADQCGAEYGVPADGGYLDMTDVIDYSGLVGNLGRTRDKYTRGVIAKGFTSTYTDVLEVQRTYTINAGLPCNGRWNCTEGTYVFTDTIAIKKTGDHYTLRSTKFSADIPADDPSNQVFERELVWTVGEPISLAVHGGRSTIVVGENSSNWPVGPFIEFSVGDGFNAGGTIGGNISSSRGFVVIDHVHLLEGSSGLQFSHAFRLDTLDDVDHTSTINTIGLALAVQQNDSGWILPDYCPTP